MSAVCLEVSDLTVFRDGRKVVDGASLELASGTIACVQGASGSGKSTLLRAIASLVPIAGGHILFEGNDVRTLAPTEYRRRVAYVPQLPRMFDGTVADNIRTGPRFRGVELSEREVAGIVDRVGLTRDIAERSASHLSGGERLRVGLARALANEPSVLLLDEPTAALDPEAARLIIDLVVAVVAQGTAALAVTHIEEHALRFGGARHLMTSGVLASAERSPS